MPGGHYHRPAMDMTQANPYQTPKAAIVEPPDTPQLATLSQRLLAYLLDQLILAAGIVVMAYGLEYWGVLSALSTAVLPLVAAALIFILYCVINGYWLKYQGQTLGKKIIGTRIVTLQGELAPLSRLLLLRYLPIGATLALPTAAQLAAIILDAGWVFRLDRRCLHDHLAGTQVVRVSPRRG